MRRGLFLGCASLLAVAFVSAPVIGQNDAPESLLPPGFNDPAPAPSQAEPPPLPEPGRTIPPPSSPATVQPLDPLPSLAGQEESDAALSEELAALQEQLEAQMALAQALPPGARRSLDLIGPLTEANGGYAASSLGNIGGRYAQTLVRRTGGRLISRWASLGLQRLLLSELNTPQGINGANFAAERAALLLRIGSADGAVRMVQAIDPPAATPRLLDVALTSYVSAADPLGMCPLLPFAGDTAKGKEWQLIRAMCAGFSGEGSSAREQIDRARRQGGMDRIDVVLAEKIVGASLNGRRAVTVQWDDVGQLTRWRFGLALTAGVEPPETLYASADRNYQAWRARAPMASLASRVQAADMAAAMGILSSSDMVDLYGAAFDDIGSDETLRDRMGQLRSAYVAADADDRVSAMEALWTRSDNAFVRYSSHILTAHAAARVAPSKDLVASSDDLIISMVSAGFDTSAARWSNLVPEGSLGWAVLALAAPGRSQLSSSQVSQFFDNDDSADARKSAFLVAGLAGLGRISDGDRDSLADELGIRFGGQSRWISAIRTAASQGNDGLVTLLVAMGMQGNDWSAMTPRQLFHVVSALRTVGRQAEARMIAAEAVSRA
ncbi:hypothetical protein [Blastomonas aquatica]|uniref:Uncharacterized protein n=1 Tax=Blastomonas aquatica TaxID=1510276 RepID=A0ABQ1JLE7_9SPHN|nr:hypothetical protein [Blastomonas aquatica]GGB69247.1 hypothetical protein GCM10010833_25580 [Blastomonas aquatica]